MTRNPIVGMVRAALWSSLFFGVCFLAPTWLHAHRDSALYPLCVYLFAALGVAVVVAALTLPLVAKQVRHAHLPGQTEERDVMFGPRAALVTGWKDDPSDGSLRLYVQRGSTGLHTHVPADERDALLRQFGSMHHDVIPDLPREALCDCPEPEAPRSTP